MADDTEKQTRTIEYVDPNVREWERDGKRMFFVEGKFENGDAGSILAFSIDKAKEAMDALNAIRDTPTEFELKRGKTYNGVQNWSIKGFPGMPQMGGGGGGGNRGGGGMSHAQAGLLAAASVLGPVYGQMGLENVIERSEDLRLLTTEWADMFTDWLFTRRGGGSDAGSREGTGQEASADQSPAAPAPAPPPSEQITLPQLARLKELAQARGIEPDLTAIATVAGVDQFTKATAAELIELWEQTG